MWKNTFVTPFNDLFCLKALYFANADLVSACHRILEITNKDFSYLR